MKHGLLQDRMDPPGQLKLAGGWGQIWVQTHDIFK